MPASVPASTLNQKISPMGILADSTWSHPTLASLHSLPIDILKIDRSFVSSMLEDRDKAVIVRTVLSLAESLNLRVTAEGIETQKLAHALQAMGCWQGQGYHFARPMDEAEAYAYWRARWNSDTI
ncbi:MAG: EAL domain-containing protein [Sphingobium sp.]